MFQREWIKPACITVALAVVTAGACFINVNQKNSEKSLANQQKVPNTSSVIEIEQPNVETVIPDEKVPLGKGQDSVYHSFIESCNQSQNAPTGDVQESRMDEALLALEQLDVNLVIARGQENFVCDILFDYANNENKINETMVVVSRSLHSLPAGLFGELKQKGFSLHIVIVGSCQNSTGITQISNENGSYLLIDSNKTILQTTLQKAIVSNIAQKIKQDVLDGKIVVSLEAFQPSGFMYGKYNKEFLYADNARKGSFINSNAQKSVQQDAAEILKLLINEPEAMKNIPTTAKMYQKIKTCAQAFCKAYPSLKKEVAFTYFIGE